MQCAQCQHENPDGEGCCVNRADNVLPQALVFQRT